MLAVRFRAALALVVLFAVEGAAIGALSAQPAPSQTYRDPAGRFTVTIPAGWKSWAENGGVVISNGTASAIVSPFDAGASAEQIVGLLSNQYAKQWQNFSAVDRGGFSLGGVPAAYGMFSGVNPRGVPALLRIAGVASRGQAFAIIASAPRQEFNDVSRALQALESSFVFGGGGAQTGGNGWGGGGNGGAAVGGAPAAPPGPQGNGQATLGVGLRDVEQGDLRQVGIQEARGAFVARLRPGGAAAQAGITEGDVVLTVGRQSVFKAADLVRIIAGQRPGDQLQLTVIRAGQVRTVNVRLAGSVER